MRLTRPLRFRESRFLATSGSWAVIARAATLEANSPSVDLPCTERFGYDFVASRRSVQPHRGGLQRGHSEKTEATLRHMMVAGSPIVVTRSLPQTNPLRAPNQLANIIPFQMFGSSRPKAAPDSRRKQCPNGRAAVLPLLTSQNGQPRRLSASRRHNGAKTLAVL